MRQWTAGWPSPGRMECLEAMGQRQVHAMFDRTHGPCSAERGGFGFRSASGQDASQCCGPTDLVLTPVEPACF